MFYFFYNEDHLWDKHVLLNMPFSLNKDFIIISFMIIIILLLLCFRHMFSKPWEHWWKAMTFGMKLISKDTL